MLQILGNLGSWLKCMKYSKVEGGLDRAGKKKPLTTVHTAKFKE